MILFFNDTQSYFKLNLRRMDGATGLKDAEYSSIRTVFGGKVSLSHLYSDSVK